MLLDEDPFTDDYLNDQLDFYDLEDEFEQGNVKVRLVKSVVGRVDDYFNKQFRQGENERPVPIMSIGGNTMMSLTWMEVQSMFIPISFAFGDVITAGLGLGYYALAVAAKDEVDKVTVFESNRNVIDFFTKSFSKRRGFDKIDIVNEDVRKLKDARADFVFMDVYQTLLPDQVVDDIRLFSKNNSFDNYRFWGQERVYLDEWVETRRMPEIIASSLYEKDFLRMWASESERRSLYEPVTDDMFREEVIEALEDAGWD